MSGNGFVRLPNLPQNDVTLCICSDEAVGALLKKRGTEVLRTEGSPFLQREVSTHPDMQLCHLGENVVITDFFQEKLSKALEERGFTVIRDRSPKSTYPEDILYNAAVCADTLFGLTDRLSKRLLSELISRGVTPVRVNQGYAKCSVCVVDSRAIITDDPGIASTAKRLGFDVLEAQKGDILLSDTHYGFIGGCSGKLSRDTVAFTGCLDSHRNGSEIRAFLKKHQCTAVELTNGILKDVGSILPVKEEKECIHSVSTSAAQSAP